MTYHILGLSVDIKQKGEEFEYIFSFYLVDL